MFLAMIVGARPQFVKIAVLIREIKKQHGLDYCLIHTGQHYDSEMSDIFFDELRLPKPDVNLEIGSESHGRQTGKMLAAIEKELLRVKPDLTLVVGDTNSTLAGALGSAKLKIPVAHVEAGLRSGEFYMPEEINRRLVDQVSELLFTPTENATRNLLNEGVAEERVFQTGDVMYDSLLHSAQWFRKQRNVLEKIGLDLSKKYAVLTLHRESNVDNVTNLKSILEALPRVDAQVFFPMHPRTRKNIGKYGLSKIINDVPNLIVRKPLGYFTFLSLLFHCSLVLTDSGGVQKEAYLLKKPCVTLRERTEWVETVKSGANVLVGTITDRIVEEANKKLASKLEIDWGKENPFGDGRASKRIVKILKSFQFHIGKPSSDRSQ